MSKKLPKNIKINKTREIESTQERVLLFKKNRPPASPLHRYIYTSTTSLVIAFLLVFSFTLQGVSVVFANETENFPPPTEAGIAEQTTEISTEPVELTTETEDNNAVSTTETSTVTPVVDEDTSAQNIATNTVIDTDSASTTLEDTSTPDPDISDETSTTSLTEDVDDETTSTSTNPEISTSTDLEHSTSSFPVVENDDLQATTTATSTIEGPAIETPVNVNFSDSGFTFSKSECTELASGSFYCLEPQKNTLNDALFASPDSEGDLEIFLIRDGVQTQVTNNQVDDAAPFFDQNSESIVWHRLINDRYQIISYDLKSGNEEQITNDSTNNMEPMRQGKYTVWQKWTDNNWDIMLFDGSKTTQITHTSAHDIAPYIHGSLIVWNRYTKSGEKTIDMYDISTGTYVTVDDPTGLSVSNPRMVLVYDQMHPNGDVVTKGYDLIAKRFIQLDTLPRQIPLDIPKSEPTHETRALIQSKPSIKGDEIINNDINPNKDPILPPLDIDGASSSQDLILDMTIPSDAKASSTNDSINEFDLIIESVSSTTENK